MDVIFNLPHVSVVVFQVGIFALDEAHHKNLEHALSNEQGTDDVSEHLERRLGVLVLQSRFLNRQEKRVEHDQIHDERLKVL